MININILTEGSGFTLFYLVVRQKTKHKQLHDRENFSKFVPYFSCDDLDTRQDSHELEVPQAMVSLHLEMAPTYFVDKWGLLDVGQLGPAVRLGWFLPSRTEQSFPPLYDHWKVFRDPSEVSPFLLTKQQEDFIREKVKRGNGR